LRVFDVLDQIGEDGVDPLQDRLNAAKVGGEPLRYWSDLLGRTRTQTHGETYGADGHRSRSRNEHVDDLAPLHVLQQLPDGQAMLVYQNLPPTRVKLLP